MKRIFCILLLLCLYFYGFGQSTLPPEKGLAIGDTMPDLLMDQLYNYPSKTVRFAAFQKDLTIIDFWASWCGACVGSFDKLQGLQKQYDDRLQLLMVNASPGEDSKKLAAFLKRRKQRSGKTFTLPYSIQDTVLSTLFPFKVIPHCVWLNRERKVVAITDTEAITAANIEGVLAGKITALPFKNDALLFDESRDQLMPVDSSQAGIILTQSLITSEQTGRGVKLAYEAAGGREIKKMMVLNHSLLSLFQLSSADAFRLSNGRIIIDSAVQSLFGENIAIKDRPKFCYELNTKPILRKEAVQWLETDLERYFKVRAVADEQWMPVFILKAGKLADAMLTKNATPESDLDEESLQPFIRNGSIQELRYFLERILHKPVVDETAISKGIDIFFPKGFKDFNAAGVSKFLTTMGIELQEGERLMPVTRLQPINN